MSDDIPTTEPIVVRTDQAASHRYAQLHLEDDAVIVYDRDRTDAWIQSDVTVSVPTRFDAVNAPDGSDSDPTETGGD